MKKFFVFLSIMMMIIFVFTGCSSSASNAPAADVDKSEKIEIKNTEVITEESKKEDKKTKEEPESTVKEVVEETPVNKDVEAYNAYLEFLMYHPELNISDLDNSPKKVISISDCYGDDYPELIYTEGFQYPGDDIIGAHFLHMATYQNGQVIEKPIDISFDITVAAGSSCITLFTSGNNKDLYYLSTYSEFGDDFDGRVCDFADLYKIDDGTGKLLYSCVTGWDSESGDDIHIYYKDGNKISESDFNNETGDIISNVKLIYQCHDNLENADVYGIVKNLKDKAEIMTYDEAIAFLQNQTK